jgi:predicted NBD/HSP70 family sugar kinase
MYIGIDIGGTKTLLCTLTDEGVIKEEIKFLTPKSYDEFLIELKTNFSSLKVQDFKAGGLAMPATSLDREHGIGETFGNLPWHNAPIQHDVQSIIKAPLVVENDAKLACLSEAMLLKDKFSRVLYVTVSTGIGYGLVVNCRIDPNVGDGGGRTILQEHEGKMMPWEDFASGRAIVERYGKKAMDITDEDTWKRISADLAKGFIELIAITEPEVIVIGGGVGNYFERFGKFLSQDIKEYSIPLIAMPKLVKAQRPDEAVIYGCYDLAKQVYVS